MALAIVGLFVGPVTEVVKYFGEPIMRQFNYLCCFNSNKEDLKENAEKLEEQREQVQRLVSAARNNVEDILSEATKWLGEVGDILDNKNDIDNQIKDIPSGCLDVKSHFLLSRKVKKTAEAMEKLMGTRPQEGHISHRPLPPSMEMPNISETPTPQFETRKQIEQNLIAILKDERVNVVGICGMGGVGKTTLAQRIKDRVKVEHIFGESVMAVVSQQQDKLKIQDELAENLGLDLKMLTILSSRAHKLRSRLTNGEKRILVILDDVWDDLDLEELGIPCKIGCTILLTSRNKDVLERMNAVPIREMEMLSEIEASSLFEQNVGTGPYDQTLLSISQDVVKECKGLPLALVTVARALKGHGISDWHEALRQLKNSNPEDLETFLKHVYTPLRFSYDFLTENAKSIFLLCCLFPEDGDIPVKDLAAYAMGLHMFDGTTSWEQLRNQTYSLVGKLKSRCLLLEGSDEHHVRMHDVVQDVAIYIASSEEKKLIKCGDMCVWISPFFGERIELSKAANFPNLRLLLAHGHELKISDNPFEGVIDLSVLSIKSFYSWKSSLPHTTQLQKSLRTLVLDDVCLETISVVAEFENLEIFICRNCHHIKMLPIEVGRLVRLKLLEFSNCSRLDRVAPGIISCLVGLEELKMVTSFNGWEAEKNGKERKNAALSELQFLSSLTCLTIEIKDVRLVAEQFKLPANVVKYDISFGAFTIFRHEEFERKIYVNLDGKEISSSAYWFAKCASDVECMWFNGEGSNIVDLQQAHQNMRWLTLGCSSTLKKLVNITSSIGGITTVFRQLEYLSLGELPNLEEICHIDGPIQERSSIDVFRSLKEVRLFNLLALKQWWKSSPYQHNACLPQLQELHIRHCKMMEQIFLWTEEENENHEIETFPKLKILTLWSLPSLTSFSKGIQRIGFPLLTQMEIKECPQLRSLVSNHDEDHDSSPLFSKQIPVGTLSGFERLKIKSCGKIKSLFSSSTAQNLHNLNKLIIEDCGEMIKVFEDDKGETSRLFLELQKLKMIGLPKLKQFCNWAQKEFPSLTQVSIFECPNMERLSLGSLTAPNLKTLWVDFKDIGMGKDQDLNAELQQHFLKAKEEESFYKWLLKVRGMRGARFYGRYKRLKLTVDDCTVASEQISFPSHIVRYDIKIGTIRGSFSLTAYDRCLSLKLPREITLGNWIHECVRSVEYLQLRGEGCINLDLGQAQNLRNLTLGDSSMVKSKLVNVTSQSSVFPYLEILKLENLPSLEEIYHIDGPMPERSTVNAFNSLRKLYLTNLPELKHLWKSDSPYQNNPSFLQLEILDINRCEMMEHLFLWNHENDTGSQNHQITIIFPNLTNLVLSNLPRLKAVCNAIESIKFPLLSELDVVGCPQLKSIVSISCSTVNNNRNNSEGIDNGDDGDDCLHLFCKLEKVDFCGLKKLSISRYENISSIWCHQILIKYFFAGLKDLSIYDVNIRSLFSYSIVANLNNLQGLSISSCGEMVKVIEDDDKETDALSEMSTVCVFPKLQFLQIKALPKLEMFWGWKSCSFELPSLSEVYIDSCPEMKRFSLGSVIAPYQVGFKIDDKEVINHTNDLNVMLQQPVFRETYVEEEEEAEETEEEQPN